MFCSNCGNRLADGAKFCSECGAKVQDAAGQEFRFGDDVVFKEPKLDTGAVKEPESKTMPKKESVSFDWSAVVDEPHKREIPDVRSPWATTGGIDEKELYAEMTPSTDRSRTMSFIGVLKAEKEEKERRAEERAFVYTDVLEVDADMSSFNDAPTLTYAPLYDDVDAPVKTPFDDVERKADRRTLGGIERETDRRTLDGIERKTDRRTLDGIERKADRRTFDDIERPVGRNTFSDLKKPVVEASRETIAQFDEYVKSFEAGAGIVHDEPRFEKPEPATPVDDEPKFELPDFLRRAASASKDEPVFETASDSAVSLEELSGSGDDPDFRRDVIDEPTFEVPKIEEIEEEPVFEEPKYEEPVFDEIVFDEGSLGGDFNDGFNEYLDMDATREREPVNEEALFAEMQRTKPAKTGMTIAAPADKEDEIEALRNRLMELTGTDKKLDEEPKDVTIKPEDLYLSELPPEVSESEPELLVLDNPAPAPVVEEVKAEPEPVPVVEEVKAEAAAPAVEDPAVVVFGELSHDTAPAVEEVKSAETAAAPVVEEVKAEPAPAPVVEEVKTEAAAPAVEDPAVVVFGELSHDTAPAVEEVKSAEPAAAPAVEEVKVETAAPSPAVEEVKLEAPAPAPVVEEVKVEEPAPTPVVEEVKAEEPAAPAPVVEEVKAEPALVVEEIKTEAPAAVNAAAPKEEKASDALSLEDLEKDLFGETPAADVEAEETKKIDKFYTLYRKNEEFQRLLDEEYDKLKGGSQAAAASGEVKAEAGGDALKATAAEIPAEQNKAYRQVDDETIYKDFEIPQELVKAPPAEVPAGTVAAPAADGKKSAKQDKKASKEDKKLAKAEKAKLRQEKKAAKARAKAGASDDAEYEEVDTGSGFLTVLAVIIAVILVILLAVILILQVAPDSSIAFAIDSLISKLTGDYGAIDPGNGPFLL